MSEAIDQILAECGTARECIIKAARECAEIAEKAQGPDVNYLDDIGVLIRERFGIEGDLPPMPEGDPSTIPTTREDDGRPA